MASLTAKLQLSGSNLTSDALSISVTDVLTVTNPTIPVARLSIATGSYQSLIASNAAHSYVYIKNISGTASTDYVELKFGATLIAKLRVGEYLFLPLTSALAITAQATGNACIMEYGYWSI